MKKLLVMIAFCCFSVLLCMEERGSIYNSEKAILLRLNELEEQYELIKDKYLELLNAYKANNDSFKTEEDEKQFYVVWEERDAIAKETEKLVEELRKKKKQSKKFEKFVGELSKDAGLAGISIPEIPAHELLARASRADLYYQAAWQPDIIEKRLRQMLARYHQLQNKKNDMSPDKTDYEDYQKVNEALTNVDNEMIKLVKDERTPAYIYEIYRNERFPSDKPILPAERFSEEPPLISKKPLAPVEPLKPGKRLRWAESVEEYEAQRPEREKKRAEKLLKEKYISPAIEQSLEKELIFSPEKSIPQSKQLIKPIAREKRKEMEKQYEMQLKKMLEELQQALLYLANTLRYV